ATSASASLISALELKGSLRKVGAESDLKILLGSLRMASKLTDPTVKIDPKSTVGGGVEDVYGEDTATEDQLITPWTYSVASGYSLLRDPQYNKGR
ncbi:hypothetical protein DVA78_18170, partial [Acinetobacter baumannii]